MKRVISAVALVAAGFCAEVAAAPAASTPAPKAPAVPAPAHHSRLAPADEYFGPLKVSILGIRNEIHDIALRYDAEPDRKNALFGQAVQAETALKDWERKYPQDGAVVRQVYYLRMLYAKFDLAEAQLKRQQTELWLFTRYGSTWYSKDVKTQLAKAPPTAVPAGAAAAGAPVAGASVPVAQPTAAGVSPIGPLATAAPVEAPTYAPKGRSN